MVKSNAMLLSPRLGIKLHTSQQYEDSFPSKVGQVYSAPEQVSQLQKILIESFLHELQNSVLCIPLTVLSKREVI